MRRKAGSNHKRHKTDIPIIEGIRSGDNRQTRKKKKIVTKGDRTRTGLHGLSVQKDTNDDQKSDSVQDHTKSKENK